jgi:hypothetical protein
MIIRKISPLSGNPYSMDINITIDELNRINNRFGTTELIQNIVPNLSADEREFLISGITPAEWESLYGEPNN